MGTAEGVRTVAVLVDACGEVVMRVIAGRVDLDLVGSLGRLQLAATRRGRRLAVRDPVDELSALIDLSGLSDAFGLRVVARGVAQGQAMRETEGGEQVLVEEVVDLGDATA